MIEEEDGRCAAASQMQVPAENVDVMIASAEQPQHVAVDRGGHENEPEEDDCATADHTSL